MMVTTTTPGGQRVSVCTCTRTGRHLATFTRLDVTFDESVCFYRLHPHASHSVPLAPLFLVPVPPPGHAPSGVSQVNPPPSVEPLEISYDSPGPSEGGDPAAEDTAATGRSPRLETPPGFLPRLSLPPLQPAAVDSGAKIARAEPGVAKTEGDGSRGAATGGAATGGAGSGGADSGGAASASGGGAVGDPAGGPGTGQPPQLDLLETLLPHAIRAWIVRQCSPGGGGYGPAGAGAASLGGTACAGGVGGIAGGAGGAAGAGGTRGAAGAGGTGDASPRGTGGAAGAGGAKATSPGGATGARGAGPTSPRGTAGAACAGGAGAGGTRGARAAGPRGAHTGGARAAGVGGAAGTRGAGAAGVGGAGARGTVGAGAADPGGARTRGAGPTGAGGAAGAGGAGGATEAAGTGGARGTAGSGGAGAGGTRGTGDVGAAGPGGARTRGAGAAGAGGVGGAGGATGAAGTIGARGTAGARGAGAAGARSATGAIGAGGVSAAGGGGAGAAGTTPRRPFFYPQPQSSLPPPDSVLRQVLSLPSSTGLTPLLLCPPTDPSQPQLLPGSPLPAPAPHTEVTESLTECREHETRASTPVRARRVARPCPPAVPGTHGMALRPSSVPQRVVLPEPPASSLPHVPDPESNLARAASPTVTRLLASVVTDPEFESTAAFALVTELVVFAARSHLDYVASLVTESGSVYPPTVGDEPSLSSDILQDRQFELECLATALPHFASMLLCPEGDPDAFDIPTPRSYAEAIAGEYSSQWQTAMDAEMASWKSTCTYLDAVPPPGANIVDGMWIFRVKRPPGSPPAFKARYVARGFCQRQGVDFFQTFSPTPKMTTLGCCCTLQHSVTTSWIPSSSP
ncbi:unnamed protein product [Closterium sp. NIES-54]